MEDKEIIWKPKGKSPITIKESELAHLMEKDKKQAKVDDRIQEFSDDLKDDGKRNYSNKKKRD